MAGEVTELERFFLSESNAIEDEHSPEALEDAIAAWNYLKAQTKLTHKVVLTVHKLLMHRLLPKYAGKYRRMSVWVGNSRCPSWRDVRPMVGIWLLFQASSFKSHAVFEFIHPFVDGNGRVGRMLYNWARMRWGLPIEVIYAAHRGKYYSRIVKALGQSAP